MAETPDDPVASLGLSRGTFETAVGLPPGAYHDADFFRFEVDAVFGSQWLCVGRSEQLGASGDYLSTTIAGEPIIVVRQPDGALHAMSAVCQHRAMCVTADVNRGDDDMLDPPLLQSGTTRQFRCPYHHWVYGLDGALLGAPEMDRTTGFDKGDVELPALGVEVWQGFVFVNLDVDAEPLGPRMSKFDAVVANHHLDELITVDPLIIPDVPFNWKIMIENFMEMYHNSRLHHGIHDWAPSSGAWYADWQPGDGVMYGFNQTLEQGGGFNPTFEALFPLLPDTTEDERQRVVFALAPPNLLIGIQSDLAFWFVVNPTGPTTHELSMGYLFPAETLELPLFDQLLELTIEGVANFNRQDIPTNIATQMGMQSRFAPRGRLSWQEAVIAQFSSWLVDRYEAAGSAVSVPMRRT